MLTKIYPHSLIHKLRGKNINFFSIYEDNRGVSDADIIELSKNLPKIILTEDKDFGECVFAHNAKSISVIFLRYSFSDLASITQVIIKLIKKENMNLFRLFVTVTTERIRYRSIK